MEGKQICEYIINKSLKHAEKTECFYSVFEKHELNLELGRIQLLRTIFNWDIQISTIKDNKKGNITINRNDKESIDKAIDDVIYIMNSSNPDEAYDISPYQKTESFQSGKKEPDFDLMYERFDQYIKTVNRKYPNIVISGAVISFEKCAKHYFNSNETCFSEVIGRYDFFNLFTCKEGSKISSFNVNGFYSIDLQKDIIDYADMDNILKQLTEQLNTKAVMEKFTGDIIITPICLGNLLNMYINTFLGDYPLISGTSPLKNSLDTKIGNDRLTLHSVPVSDKLDKRYYITNDGFKAENSILIRNGILKSYALSLYGANKTGKKRALNNSDSYYMEPGNVSYNEIIKNTKRGILLCRYSGGRPNPNGDFSVVAKNSFYIENGIVRYPLNETMISGNLKDMIMNIKEISKESINFGDAVLPWISMSGFTISGR